MQIENKLYKNLSKTISIEKKYFLLDLRRHFNNDGISYDAFKGDGDFNGYRATYPAEELPASNSLIYMGDVPFYFPSKEDGFMNNFALTGQSIGVEPDYYKNIFVLGAVEGMNGEVYEEEVTVSFEDGTYKNIYIGLSNWLLSPKYNETAAFQCSHIHIPEQGMETVKNKQIQEIDNYNENNQHNFYFPMKYSSQEIELNLSKQGIWRPKIWMQKVKLNAVAKIIGFTFMDNLNYHIFAITLEH